jgi:hypothetical protein
MLVYKEHSLAGLFFLSISANLAQISVCSKLLSTKEFANNLIVAFKTICIYIFCIKSWPESISSGVALFHRFCDWFVTESRTKSNLFFFVSGISFIWQC